MTRCRVGGAVTGRESGGVAELTAQEAEPVEQSVLPSRRVPVLGRAGRSRSRSGLAWGAARPVRRQDGRGAWRGVAYRHRVTRRAVGSDVPVRHSRRNRPRGGGNAAHRAVVQVVVVAGRVVASVMCDARRWRLGETGCGARLRGCGFSANFVLRRFDRGACGQATMLCMQDAQSPRHGGRQGKPQHRGQREPGEPAQGLAGQHHGVNWSKRELNGERDLTSFDGHPGRPAGARAR